MYRKTILARHASGSLQKEKKTRHKEQEKRTIWRWTIKKLNGGGFGHQEHCGKGDREREKVTEWGNTNANYKNPFMFCQPNQPYNCQPYMPNCCVPAKHLIEQTSQQQTDPSTRRTQNKDVLFTATQRSWHHLWKHGLWDGAFNFTGLYVWHAAWLSLYWLIGIVSHARVWPRPRIFEGKGSGLQILTAGPMSPVSPFLPFLPRLPGGPGGPSGRVGVKMMGNTENNC